MDEAGHNTASAAEAPAEGTGLRVFGENLYGRYGVDPGVAQTTSGFGLGESAAAFAMDRAGFSRDVQSRWTHENAPRQAPAAIDRVWSRSPFARAGINRSPAAIRRSASAQAVLGGGASQVSVLRREVEAELSAEALPHSALETRPEGVGVASPQLAMEGSTLGGGPEPSSSVPVTAEETASTSQLPTLRRKIVSRVVAPQEAKHYAVRTGFHSPSQSHEHEVIGVGQEASSLPLPSSVTPNDGPPEVQREVSLQAQPEKDDAQEGIVPLPQVSAATPGAITRSAMVNVQRPIFGRGAREAMSLRLKQTEPGTNVGDATVRTVEPLPFVQKRGLAPTDAPALQPGKAVRLKRSAADEIGERSSELRSSERAVVESVVLPGSARGDAAGVLRASEPSAGDVPHVSVDGGADEPNSLVAGSALRDTREEIAEATNVGAGPNGNAPGVARMILRSVDAPSLEASIAGPALKESAAGETAVASLTADAAAQPAVQPARIQGAIAGEPSVAAFPSPAVVQSTGESGSALRVEGSTTAGGVVAGIGSVLPTVIHRRAQMPSEATSDGQRNATSIMSGRDERAAAATVSQGDAQARVMGAPLQPGVQALQEVQPKPRPDRIYKTPSHVEEGNDNSESPLRRSAVMTPVFGADTTGALIGSSFSGATWAQSAAFPTPATVAVASNSPEALASGGGSSTARAVHATAAAGGPPVNTVHRRVAAAHAAHGGGQPSSYAAVAGFGSGFNLYEQQQAAAGTSVQRAAEADVPPSAEVARQTLLQRSIAAPLRRTQAPAPPAASRNVPLPPAAASAQPAASEANITRIANQVYEMLTRRLASERQRRGA